MGKLSGKPVTPLYLKSSMPTYSKNNFVYICLQMVYLILMYFEEQRVSEQKSQLFFEVNEI